MNVGEGMKDMEGVRAVCVIEGVVWVMSEGEGVSLEDPTRQIHTYCTRTQTLHAPHPSHFDASMPHPFTCGGHVRSGDMDALLLMDWKQIM